MWGWESIVLWLGWRRNAAMMTDKEANNAEKDLLAQQRREAAQAQREAVAAERAQARADAAAARQVAHEQKAADAAAARDEQKQAKFRDKVEQLPREQGYRDRGVDFRRDITGKIYPIASARNDAAGIFGVQPMADGNVHPDDLAAADAAVGKLAPRKVDPPELVQARAEARNLGSLAEYHKAKLKKFDTDNGLDFSVDPAQDMGSGPVKSQLDALKTAAAETSGFFDKTPTPAAVAAKAQFDKLQPQYDALVQQRRRMADEFTRLDAAAQQAKLKQGAMLDAVRGPGAAGVDSTGGPEPTGTDAMLRAEAASGTTHVGIHPMDEFHANYIGDEATNNATLVQNYQKVKTRLDELATDIPAMSDHAKVPLIEEQKFLTAMLPEKEASLKGRGLWDKVRDPTISEYLRGGTINAAEGLGTAAVDALEFAGRNMIRATGSHPDTQGTLAEFAEAMRQTAAEWKPDVPPEVADKIEANFWAGDVAKGAGSTVTFMVPAGIVARLGKVAGLSAKVVAALTTATVAATGAASEGNSLRRTAAQVLDEKLKAGEITQAERDSGVNAAEGLGALLGLTEAVPVARFAKRLSAVPAGKTFVRLLVDALAKGGKKGAAEFAQKGGRLLIQRAAAVMGETFEEAVQELGQGIGEEAIAQGRVGNEGWKPKGDVVTLDAVRAGEAGGMSGFLFSLLTSSVEGIHKARRLGKLRADGRGEAGGSTEAQTEQTKPIPEGGNTSPKPPEADPFEENAAPPVDAELQADLNGKTAGNVVAPVNAEVGKTPVEGEDTSKPVATPEANGTAPTPPEPSVEQSPAAAGGNTERLGVGEPGGGPAFTETKVSTPEKLEGEKINKAWTAFSPESKTLGIPRAEMPQIKSEHRGALTQFLKGRGIEHTQEEVLPGTLKPTQAEYSQGKVDKARGFEGESRSILVSSDNHVLDGHHQWMADLTDHPNQPIKVIRLNAPIRELIKQVPEFPSAETAGGATKAAKLVAPEIQTEKAKPAQDAIGKKVVRAALDAQDARAAEAKKKADAAKVELPSPIVARGKNKPAEFVRAVVKATGLKGTSQAAKFLMDFAPRLHRANPDAFSQMEVHALTGEQWKENDATRQKTSDSSAAYNPETNTLFLHIDRLKGDPEKIASAIVHEAGHFAEKFALGEAFTQAQWESLKDSQREKAAREYRNDDHRTGAVLKNDPKARAEWVAMQFARVVRGDTEGMSGQMKLKLKAWLEQVKDLVTKWLGGKHLTTKELDARIVELLGYGEERAETSPTGSQQAKVEKALAAGGAKTANQLAQELDIINHNIRRILGEGAKAGKFERIGRGVYALKNANGSHIYVESADAVATLPELARRGVKVDFVFLDPPYKTAALVGGNRGVKDYAFISPDSFSTVVAAAKQMLRKEDAPIYFMFSQAPSGMKQMQKYTDVFDENGLKLVATGQWRKTFKDGSPVTNPRGELAAPEGIALFNITGKYAGETLPGLDFTMVRPPVAGEDGRQSQKPKELYSKLLGFHTADVPESERPNFISLDPFAGTGGLAAASQEHGISNISLELDEGVIQKFIGPKLEKGAGKAANKPAQFSEDLKAKAHEALGDLLGTPSDDETTMKLRLYPHLDANNSPLFSIKSVGADAYDIESPSLGVDGHVSKEGGQWTLDVFHAGEDNADDAHIESIDLGKKYSPEAIRKALVELDQSHGLSSGNTLGTPAEETEDYEQTIPHDRAAKLLPLVSDMVKQGVNTPEKLAAFIDETFGAKGRKISQSLWNFLSFADPKLTGRQDWKSAYSKIDNAEKTADTASDEQRVENPQAGDAALAGEQKLAGTGVSERLGGEQPEAGDRVGGGRQPDEAGAGRTEPSVGRDSAGEAGRDDAPVGRGDLPDLRRPESQPRSVATSPGNYVITDADRIGKGGQRAKYQDNIAAIKLVKQIEAEGRPATREEQAQLVRYVGWGGIKSVFKEGGGHDWAKQHEELKALLTPEEFAAARRSVQDAHYTSPTVVQRGIYAALKRFGFTGGKMIEGGVGIGHFIGMMPAEMRAKSSYVGVEKDPLTARIAQLLYPEAKIHNMGFEQADMARGTFDGSAGNPPFGDQQLFDKNFKEASKQSIHNYFILKQLELLRPGGVGAYVVSHYFLDAQDTTAREAIAKQADFLGAIRLPNTAFKENAGTEVTTDLVFFRKRSPGEAEGQGNWTGTKKWNDAKSGDSVNVNEWLLDHPDMVLGEHSTQGTMYAGRKELTVNPREGADLGRDLDAAVKKLPENIYDQVDAGTKERLTAPERITKKDAEIPQGTKVNGYFMDESGNLRVRTADSNMEKFSAPADLNEGEVERVKGILPIRDALNRMVAAELADGTPEAQLAMLRKTLNKKYDEFVKKFGHLNRQANRRAFFDDPESARVLGLEKDFDAGVSAPVAKKKGIAAKAPSAKKASIFEKRVNAPYREVTKVDTPKEALMVSLNQRGEVDPDHMAELTGKDKAAVLAELKGLVFKTPRGGYESKEQYLSGNVRQKLAEAEEAANGGRKYRRQIAEVGNSWAGYDERDFNETTKQYSKTESFPTEDEAKKWQAAANETKPGSEFSENVEALKAVIPADINPTDIAVPIGAGWVPASDVKRFAAETTGRAPNAIVYRPHDGGWLFRHEGGADAWGTKRASFGEIFSDLMNGKPTIIYDTDRDGKRTVNAEATALAAAKGDEIRSKWDDWIWKDEERRNRLARIYNDTFNNYVDPHYDGSHLTLPGASALIDLRQHQKSVVWRTITDRRALYDHVVGAGKTFAGIAAFMEMKRLGRVRKALFAVPNHLTQQWRDDFIKLYPNANVLTAGAGDFTKENRQRLFAKILTGDYDAVVIGHSQLKKIGVAAGTEEKILNEMVGEIDKAVEEMKKAEGGKKTRPVAQAEKAKERLMTRLSALADGTGKKDSTATFEELGLDGLFVDEAHEFKNLFYTTQMQRVAGLGDPAGSAKAFDLYLKTRYLRDRYGGKAPLVFATGTPISNSLVEMFTMQRYLQPEALEGMGLKSLDAWAKVFADVRQVYEVDPTGTGYRMATRLANFRNIAELASTYRTVADVVTMDDLKAQAAAKGEVFPIPTVEGGKPNNVVVDRSPEQEAYFGIETQQLDGDGKPVFDHEGNPVVSYPTGTILHRVDNMPTDPRKDNMLKLTNDARKAGLDMRLIDPNAIDSPGSKINRAVGDIVGLYKKWHADKGTQLVFCDLSVPASARGKATAKANEKLGNFYFTRGLDGQIKPAQNAAEISVPEAGDHKFIGVKEHGVWKVYETTTGISVGMGDNKQIAGINAARNIGRYGKDGFSEEIAKKAFPVEQVAAAREEWEAARKPAEDTVPADDGTDTPAEQAEEGISVDELLADQSKFSVYDDVKAKLIKAGIPEKEIAFIHDYDTPDKKAKLFKQMNDGDVRVLLGSTPKLGAGTNVQKRIVGLHHLDAPWRPSDLEQREGRGIRQGNDLYARDPEGFRLAVNRYATKQTYDTRMWQLLEHKARGIEGFRKADRTTRTMEDISGEAANASDMKAAASGDPLIQKEIEMRNDRARLELLKKAWTRNRFELENSVRWLADAPKRYKSVVDAVTPLIEARQPKPDPFAFTLADGTKLEKKDGIAKETALKIKLARDTRGSMTLGHYRGFDFSVRVTSDYKGDQISEIFAKPEKGKDWNPVTQFTKDDTLSDSGIVQRMDNYLDGQERQIQGAAFKRDAETAKLAEAQAELAKGFSREDELTGIRKEHEAVRTQLMDKKRKKAVAPAAEAKPADAPEGGSLGTPSDFSSALRSAWDRYDNTGEITYSDLVNEVDAAVGETTDARAADLQTAIDRYRDEHEEDRKLAGRGDMEQAESDFTDALKAAIGKDTLGTPADDDRAPPRAADEHGEKPRPVPEKKGDFYRSYQESSREAGLDVPRDTYTRFTDKMAEDGADAVIAQFGEAEAIDRALDDRSDMPGAIRSAVAVKLQRELNARWLDTSKTAEERRAARSAALRLAEIKGERSTDQGQEISYLRNVAKFSKEATLAEAEKMTKARRDALIKPEGERAIKEAADALQKANEAAIEEATTKLMARLRKLNLTKAHWQYWREQAAKRMLAFVSGEKGGQPLQPVVQELTGRIVAEMRKRMAPEGAGKKAPAKSAAQLLGEAFKNKEKFGEVFSTVRDSFVKEFGEESKEVEQADAALADIGVRPYSKATLDRAIREAHKVMGGRISDLIRAHYSTLDLTGRTLAQKLVVDAGLTGADAKQLAEEAQARFAELTRDAKRQALQKLAARGGGLARRMASEADKLIELSNLGALGHADFAALVAERLKLPRLTNEQAERLGAMAEKIQSLPEGSLQRHRAEMDTLGELKKLRGIGKLDVASSIYYAHILSGYTTQAVNAFSTILNTAADIATLVTLHPATLPHALRGIREGALEGYTHFLSILKTGDASGHFDDKIAETPMTLEILSKDKTRNAALRGYATALRYVGRAMKATDAVFFHAAQEAFANVAAARIVAAQEAGLPREEVNRRVRDLLGMNPADFVKALAQAKGEGLTGLDLELRTGEIIRKTREKIMLADGRTLDQGAVGFGREATFNDKPRGYLGVVAKYIRDASDKVPAIKLFVPFTNIVANVANATLNYSPVGATRAKFGYGGETAPTGDARNALYLKSAAGTLAMIAAYAWGWDDPDDKFKRARLTANGPADAAARNQLRATGWKPHSLRVGDTYVSYLETPLAMPLAFIGNWIDGVKYNKLGEKELVPRAMTAAGMLGQTMINMSFLQGLGNLVDVMRGQPGAVERFTQNTIASAEVPNLVRQLDRTFDPTVHEAKGVAGLLTSGIPGLRQQQPVRETVTAKPVTSSPLDRFGQRATGDALAETLARQQAWIPEASKSRKIGNREMTPAEQRVYAHESGLAIDRALRAAEPALARMTKEQAHKYVQDVARREHERVFAALPSLMRARQF